MLIWKSKTRTEMGSFLLFPPTSSKENFSSLQLFSDWLKITHASVIPLCRLLFDISISIMMEKGGVKSMGGGELNQWGRGGGMWGRSASYQRRSTNSITNSITKNTHSYQLIEIFRFCYLSPTRPPKNTNFPITHIIFLLGSINQIAF